ncbi:MAG: peptidoglycan DL-endopeptidase RipB [Solirubrobacteraceae bacterium]|jgi:cell wall-associated NlpC family hydrolase|nr:peptidoglycan DL-endopeptidase RipB [Solirubrobacteraceae bacterium]
MRRRATIATAVAGLAIAGCGSGGVHEIAPWKSEAPYLPPPELQARSAPAASTPGAGTSAGRGSGAPTDAEVTRDLERAFGPGGARSVDAAGLSGEGLATIPPSAPARVAAIIRAGNSVARKPYVYGGGHGRVAGETFIDSAYDCSGSVSFALAAAGLVDSPMDSTALSRYGRPGPGRWVTIYANGGHAWMTVAGLRFDTSGRAERGSRWQSAQRGTVGFTVRHPPGL